MLSTRRTTCVCLAMITRQVVAGIMPCKGADDERDAFDYAFISNQGHGHLVSVGGKVRFSKGGPKGRTLWTAFVRKDGLRIVEKPTGKLLGIDPKTKELTLFDESGPTTIWQAISANSKEIKPGRKFQALIQMKIGEDVSRLSSDDEGVPVLGGKADILNFYIDGP